MLFSTLLPAFVRGQDVAEDPNEMPLGDVARSLRKKSPAGQPVIDDDNLSKVMDQAESHHTAGSSLRFLMAGESRNFQVAAPDATCSLSFSANAKALLSNQYAQMDLPPGSMLKLKGPATIEGDALNVSLFNGTDWHVSEVAIALTIVRKNPPTDSLPGGVTASDLLQSEVRPEKKPDQTVIYRMRAAASPSTTTVFSTPLNLDLAPGDEWHWALVQAKGYPPPTYSLSSAGAVPTPSDTTPTVPGLPILPVASQQTPPSLLEEQPQ